MKKSTLSAIYSALLVDSGYDPTDPIMEEIAKELNRGEVEKAKNAEVYDKAKKVVMKVLDTLENPAPLSEIYAEVESALPEGFTKGKFQYAMTRLWTDEIVKIEGKPNTYRKA